MIQTECGIFGIISRENIDSSAITNGLKKLQHRGRESFGVSYIDIIDINDIKINDTNDIKINDIKTIKKEGLVSDIKNENNVLSHSWLGHVRYSTAGKKIIVSINDNTNTNNKTAISETELQEITECQYQLFMKSCQPLESVSKHLGKYSLTHNGNIPYSIWRNMKGKYPSLIDKIDNDISDTLLLIALINHIAKIYYILEEEPNVDKLWSNVLEHIIKEIQGAYCLVIQTTSCFWIVRDRFGIRPLVLGIEYNNDNNDDDNYNNYNNYNNIKSIAVSSETVAFKDSYKIRRDIHPGEVVKVSYSSMEIETKFHLKGIKQKHCVFEYIYFLRDLTVADGTTIEHFRLSLGNKLGEQLKNGLNNGLNNGVCSIPPMTDKWKCDDAIICGVPTSGINYGKGLAKSLGLQYIQYLKKRTDYPWRTFILENNDKRLEACRKKFIVEADIIKDKVIILVDDSIVRGNTVSYLIKYIRKFNPKEVHFISGSPPIKHPCRYGVDFPDIEELIANQIPVDKLADHFGLDSLTYLEIDRLMELKDNVCNACFTGNYMF